MAEFSLLKLPLLPVKLVIGLMEVEDQIKLSMTYSKIEQFIKLIKYNIYNFDIHLKNENPSLDIQSTKQNFCNVRFNRVDDGEVFQTKYFINWYKDQSDRVIDLKSMNPIQDAMNVSKRLRPLFKIQFLEWKLYLDKLTTDEIMKLLPVILSEKCNMIAVYNGNIDSDLLTYIMDTMKPETALEVNSDIPSDFKHEKAFTFYSSVYKNGLWVTMEDLLSIRDRYVINLGTTNFDCEDINRFLHYWINCDQDMMTSLSLQLKKGTVFDRHVVFHQIEHCRTHCEGKYWHYIFSEKKEGKRIIGRIHCHDDEELVFSTWLPTDDCSSGVDVVTIIKTSHRLKELCAEYNEIYDEENKYQIKWTRTTRGSIERARVEEELTRFRLLREPIKTEYEELTAKFNSLLITST